LTERREPFLCVVVCTSGIADGVSELITAPMPRVGESA
jgi:hypothetical protein